jgi:hypothetical protein
MSYFLLTNPSVIFFFRKQSFIYLTDEVVLTSPQFYRHLKIKHNRGKADFILFFFAFLFHIKQRMIFDYSRFTGNTFVYFRPLAYCRPVILYYIEITQSLCLALIVKKCLPRTILATSQ